MFRSSAQITLVGGNPKVPPLLLCTQKATARLPSLEFYAPKFPTFGRSCASATFGLKLKSITRTRCGNVCWRCSPRFLQQWDYCWRPSASMVSSTIPCCSDRRKLASVSHWEQELSTLQNRSRPKCPLWPQLALRAGLPSDLLLCTSSPACCTTSSQRIPA